MITAPRTNKEWKYWGESDPLFGVLTLAGKDKGGKSPWTLEEVREQGARYFAEVHRLWARYSIGSAHCVEIGCGTGRITAQLARHFDHVTGVDVSAHQLESARRLLGNAADRVTLARVSAPTLPLADGACDGVFSCGVFQHFDGDAPALAYLREAHRVLCPGGTFCFQVPIRGIQPRRALAAPWRNSLLGVLRLLGRRRMMVYREYSGPVLLGELRDLGFEAVEMCVVHSAEHGGFETYFLARKAAPGG